MKLIVEYDQNQNSLPSGFVNAINYVVNYYDTVFTANVTVTIDVGYGEIDGQRLESDALGESEQINVNPVSYSAVRNALIAENAPGSSTLPAQPPPGNPGVLYMASSEEKALGLIGNNNNIDGYAGFDSTPGTFSYAINSAPPGNQYYFVGVVEHEFSEIMGRTSYLNYTGTYSLMDLFRYSGPNSRQFTTGAASYFSINNGATNLDNWNNFRTGNNGDLGDWAPSAGNDAYDDNSFPGVINAVTSVDLTNMAALGWVPTSASQPSSPSSPSSPSAPAGLQFVGVGEFGPNQSGALAWQSQGQIELWTNRGGALSANIVPNGSMGPGWTAFGVIDFRNGNDDIIWDNGTGGHAVIWQFSGSTLSAAVDPGGAMGPEWHVAATADFSGSGNAAMLWENTAGQVVAWYYNGIALGSTVYVNGAVSPESKVVATGDFFQTGRAAALWEDGGGHLQDWLLNGPSIQAAQTVGQIGSEWHVGGVGEFNGISSGDATGDIVWVNTSNHVQIWAMANGQVANVVIPNGLDGIEWTLQGVGDFTDSGASELLWLDGKGDAQIWQLNGTQVSVISTTAPAGTAAMPADSAGAGSASGAADQPAGSSSSLSFGDLDGFQYVAPGDTVTNPVIQDGILQLASGAVVDGPIVFAAGSTGTLIDGDQAPLPDTVMGFTAGSDHLGFAGASAAAEAQVIAAAQTIGGNTMLTFPDHTSLVLVGVTHLDTGIFAS